MSEPDPQHEAEQNPFASPRADTGRPAVAPVRPDDYGQVPFYRRHNFCSLITTAHMLVVAVGIIQWRPLLWLVPATSLGMVAVCLIGLTGPVYFNQVGKDGRLKQWSVGNRIAAVLLLVIFVAAPIVLLVMYALGTAAVPLPLPR